MSFSREQISQIKDSLKKELGKIGRSFDESTILSSPAIKHFIARLDTLPDPRILIRTRTVKRDLIATVKKRAEIRTFYESLIADTKAKYSSAPEQLVTVLDRLEKLKRAEIKALNTSPEKYQLLGPWRKKYQNVGGRTANKKAGLILFYLLTGLERLGINPVGTTNGWTHKLMKIAYKHHGLSDNLYSERRLREAITHHREKQKAIKSKQSVFRKSKH